MRRIVVPLLLLALASMPAPADEPLVAAGTDAPESATWDPGSQAWYVTSKGGAGFGLADGFISKVSAAGDVLATNWFADVDSPFGIDAFDDSLYVADGTVMRIIPIDDPASQEVIPIVGAQGLNDIEVDAATGDAYLTDSGQGRVYRVPSGGSSEVYVDAGQLDFPNGLWAEPSGLIVGTMAISSGLQGRLYRIDPDTREAVAISDPVGAIDGVVRYGEDFYVTDFVAGTFSRVGPDGSVELVAPLVPTAADLGLDPIRGVVGIPETGLNATIFLQL